MTLSTSSVQAFQGILCFVGNNNNNNNKNNNNNNKDDNIIIIIIIIISPSPLPSASMVVVTCVGGHRCIFHAKMIFHMIFTHLSGCKQCVFVYTWILLQEFEKLSPLWGVAWSRWLYTKDLPFGFNIHLTFLTIFLGFEVLVGCLILGSEILVIYK